MGIRTSALMQKPSSSPLPLHFQMPRRRAVDDYYRICIMQIAIQFVNDRNDYPLGEMIAQRPGAAALLVAVNRALNSKRMGIDSLHQSSPERRWGPSGAYQHRHCFDEMFALSRSFNWSVKWWEFRTLLCWLAWGEIFMPIPTKTKNGRWLWRNSVIDFLEQTRSKLCALLCWTFDAVRENHEPTT